MTEMTIDRGMFSKLVDRYLLIESEGWDDIQSLRNQWEKCETLAQESAFFMRLLIFLDHREKAQNSPTQI